jgi:hypothetical protein
LHIFGWLKDLPKMLTLFGSFIGPFGGEIDLISGSS